MNCIFMSHISVSLPDQYEYVRAADEYYLNIDSVLEVSRSAESQSAATERATDWCRSFCDVELVIMVGHP